MNEVPIMVTDDDTQAIRARIHRLADGYQGHEGRLVEYGVRIEMLTRQLESLHANAASREQLDAKATQLTLKLESVEKMLAPIKKGVDWVIIAVVGTVLAALLSLVVGKVMQSP